MDIVVKRGHIDGIPAELDWLVSDQLVESGRLEIDRFTWQTLDPADDRDRRLIDRFEESA